MQKYFDILAVHLLSPYLRGILKRFKSISLHEVGLDTNGQYVSTTILIFSSYLPRSSKFTTRICMIVLRWLPTAFSVRLNYTLELYTRAFVSPPLPILDGGQSARSLLTTSRAFSRPTASTDLEGRGRRGALTYSKDFLREQRRQL